MPTEDMDLPIDPQAEPIEASEPVVPIEEPTQTPEEIAEEAEAQAILAEEEAKHKQKSGSAKLKERLAKQREEAESARAESQRLRAELDAIRQGQLPQQAAPPVVAGLPTLDQFIAAYPTASLDDFEAFKVEFAIQKAQERIQAQDQQRKWDEGVQKVKAEVPDLDEVEDVRALSAAGVNLRGPMADTMLRMGPEMGVKVLHHLAQNPEEARRIAGLHPLDAAMELGSLKAGLAKANTKPETKTSKAPPPIVPIASRGASAPSTAYVGYEEF